MYTWHISHATYKFLLLALTWDLITPNRQSILRDTRTVFSLLPVIVSLRIEHWCFILCQYKTNAGSSLAMPRVRCKQLSEATMETAVEKPGDACGLHVESLTRNESTCACPARSYWAMTSMCERKSNGCASVPKHFYIFKMDIKSSSKFLGFITMVDLLKFNIIEKIPFSVYLEIPCITFKRKNLSSPTPGSSGPLLALSVFIGHGQRLQLGEVRDTNLAWVGPVLRTIRCKETNYIYMDAGLYDKLLTIVIMSAAENDENARIWLMVSQLLIIIIIHDNCHYVYFQWLNDDEISWNQIRLQRSLYDEIWLSRRPYKPDFVTIIREYW